ncbi:MAG: pseudouridine synthase [Myxococcota bacterium]|nr:pseudouridine synthase [Myxococcota bacterium]
MATIRLQKVLARAGIASRRAAEQLITAGRVRVDGLIVTELGTKVDPRRARVEVDGQRTVAESSVYVLMHKPRGVVSTMHDPEGRPSIRELLANVLGRVYPVGRLDFNTSGVLLATNDGDFVDALIHPRRSVPKKYVVKVNGAMKPSDLDVWRRGVQLEDGKTHPAKAKLLRYEGTKTWFELTLTEGRNQQVRRMGEATGFRVMRLARLSFAGLDAEGLRPGEWRYLSADEQRTLKNEYGVPKRIVSPPPPTEPRKAPRRPLARGTRAEETPPAPHSVRAARHRDPGVRSVSKVTQADGRLRRESRERQASSFQGEPRSRPQAGPRGGRPRAAGQGRDQAQAPRPGAGRTRPKRGRP